MNHGGMPIGPIIIRRDYLTRTESLFQCVRAHVVIGNNRTSEKTSSFLFLSLCLFRKHSQNKSSDIIREYNQENNTIDTTTQNATEHFTQGRKTKLYLQIRRKQSFLHINISFSRVWTPGTLKYFDRATIAALDGIVDRTASVQHFHHPLHPCHHLLQHLAPPVAVRIVAP